MMLPPLSLYIHIPWCIRKCPYCDFNSHKSPEILAEDAYIHALISDLHADLSRFPPRPLQSIFIGGGTPSLFSPAAYDKLLTELKQSLTFAPDIEITLEANPGTVEQQRFHEYRQLGINRLSLGIQSFNQAHLKSLGRVHDDKQAHKAIETARHAGFTNLNLDLMYALPQQTPEEGLMDLATAIGYKPEHLSWYQLTLEPNTLFYKQQPKLPLEDDIALLEEQGLACLGSAQLKRYEISAFAKQGYTAKHNLNYWLFGDYLGIGAGAHGKITTSDGIYRTRKRRQPKDYLDLSKTPKVALERLSAETLVFEFMLGATRLEQSIPRALFTQMTQLDEALLLPKLQLALEKKLITLSATDWQVTPFGRRFTNDLQSLFLNDSHDIFDVRLNG
jgi:putative oxygen-independent coproporphyrinogen III oxidase